MILIGENRSTGRKTRFFATFSTINLTLTGLDLNPILLDERRKTDRLRHSIFCHFPIHVLLEMCLNWLMTITLQKIGS
jgi:hypothetical protein